MFVIILPALAAGLYAFGSLGLKQAMERGATAARVTAVSNLVMALWSLPLIFFLPGQSDAKGWMAAILAGACLFFGRLVMVRALQAGDLSLVAPMLATKTILVGVFSLLSQSGEITGQLLLAAALASAGVALLQRGPVEHKERRFRAASMAASASILFAMTDVIVQGNAKLLGIGWFQPAMFLTIALLVPLLGRLQPAPADAVKPMRWGSCIMGFQTSLAILIIGLTGQATLVNIIYSSRSLWSVVVDWFAGNRGIKGYFLSRLFGALCLTLAVILAVL